MRNRAWIWLGLVPLAGVVAAQQAPPAAKPRPAATATPAAADPEAAIRERLAGYVKAFNGRNAAGLAEFFTEDAALVDEAGEATRGQDAILDQFATGFAQPTAYTLESTIESIRFVTPEVTQIEGISKLSAENEPSIVGASSTTSPGPRRSMTAGSSTPRPTAARAWRAPSPAAASARMPA